MADAKRRRGDRTDGWRVHASDPTFDLIPHIMPMRCDSQVFFEEELPFAAFISEAWVTPVILAISLSCA